MKERLTAPIATRAPILPNRRLPSNSSAQLSLADDVAAFELNRLPAEVLRYLAAVDVFRAEGSAPKWRAEVRP